MDSDLHPTGSVPSTGVMNSQASSFDLTADRAGDPTVDSLVKRLDALDSTVVSDALDSLDLPAGLGGLRPAWGTPRFVGRARTVALEVDAGGPPGPHLATAVVADARPGDVLVMANGGRLDVSCWGGILSLGCVQQGVVGVVADGACRDVAEAQELGLPVFARGVSPRTARGRLQQRAIGVPVRVEDVTVSECDLVVADDSGVVFVPADRAEEVLAAAEAIVEREAAISADIRAGVRIDQAMNDARLAGHAATEQQQEVGR
ncbi:RraA family protein [Nocardioides sp. P5_C9_2]